MSELIPKIGLLAVLLVMSAFFSGSETALFSLTNIEKRRLKEKHPSIWKTVDRLLNGPRRTLVTILIGNMIVNTMAAAVATVIAVELLGPSGVGVAIAVFTLLILMIGELTPKVFAVRHNEQFALICAVPLDFVARAVLPLRKIVRWIADGILQILIGEGRKNADLISEQELKALARIGEEEGALREQEGQMIQKLLDLGERIVREIMVPRTDIVAFDVNDSPDAFRELVRKYHFTYVPVYNETIDQLLGIVSTQKFMLSDQTNIKELIEPPYYVPETKRIDELLQEFQRMKTHVAVCVDEHGGTAGLATTEDVLEEIFGEFYDEYAKAEPLVKALGQGHFLVHGKIGLHELSESIGVTLESEVSETLNGWLLERFGRIPKVSENFRWKDHQFIIREVYKTRIAKVEIERAS